MNIFVTGGAGYVGSHCVYGLCDGGHHVLVYDNLSVGHREAVDPRATLIVGDLADVDLLERTLAGGDFEAVMHFAASAEVAESVQRPLFYYRNNVANTLSLLEVMSKHGIKKLVFSSSCATYGMPPAVPITEDMPQTPINPYGRTKLAIEWLLRDSAAAWGLGATALRYFNAAGAAPDGRIGEDHDPESHLIPRVLKVALGQSDQIKIFGIDYPTADGSCVRDYVHVADLSNVHGIAIETQPVGQFRCYNVGTGQGVSVKELVEVAREVTGHEIPASPSPRREGDPPELYADPTFICTELGWQPEYTDIRRVLETAWQWHRTHPRGYSS
ncbi:MAG: UDP-glucose 4-epimerase GalE [Phycisphaerales bacterium]|nr:MAG: UDP-glucose 4-epimerase GalE [Phycisphaerales bacterium]